MGKENINKKLIIYCGEDKKYFASLMVRFRSTYPNVEYKVVEIFEKDPQKFHEMFAELFEHTISFIFVDFCVNQEAQAKFALTLKRVSKFSKVPIVGLVSSTLNINKIQASMVDVIHVKSGELHDLIYDPFVLRYPAQAANPGFAVAKTRMEVNLSDQFRICYVAETYMRVEGNSHFEVGDSIELETGLTNLHIKSNKFIVKKSYKEDFYYDYRFAYDLEFVFLEPPELEAAYVPEGEEETEEMREKQNKLYQEKMQDFEILLKKIKKTHREWILDNLDNGNKKVPKILIVDEFLDFLTVESSTMDSYPFLIRCQTVFKEDLEMLDSVRPDIIAMQFFLEESEEEYESEDVRLTEERDAFHELIKAGISSVLEKVDSISNGYRPHLLIFKSEGLESKKMQDFFNYPLIICNSIDLKLEYIAKVAHVYQEKKEKEFIDKTNKKIIELREKDYQKNGRLTVSDFIEKRFYFSKNNDLSYCSYQIPVNIKKLSESEIVFESKRELDFSNYQVFVPVEMLIRMAPLTAKVLFEKDSGLNIYRALIHGINEKDKMLLRQKVNDIFVEPKMEEERKLKLAFDEVNKKALEKIEEEVIKKNELDASDKGTDDVTDPNNTDDFDGN